MLTLHYNIPSFNYFEKGLLKTSQEKEKMLVTRIFSLSHHVFLPIKEYSKYSTNICRLQNAFL